jgi:hypothetical protein
MHIGYWPRMVFLQVAACACFVHLLLLGLGYTIVCSMYNVYCMLAMAYEARRDWALVSSINIVILILFQRLNFEAEQI